MAAASVAERAAEILLTDKGSLAHAITTALYAEMPGLTEKYGEKGRTRCLEDMRHHLEHLAPAVALAEPALFVRYVTWLRDLLGARGVPTTEVRRSLELTRTLVGERMPADAAELVAYALSAGPRALDEPTHA